MNAQKTSAVKILFNLLIAVIPFGIGLYVLIEKKMIIGGRLAAGQVQQLEFPADWIMASAFFLVAFSIVMGITRLKYKNRLIEAGILLAMVLFGLGVFL